MNLHVPYDILYIYIMCISSRASYVLCQSGNGNKHHWLFYCISTGLTTRKIKNIQIMYVVGRFQINVYEF